MPIQFFTLYHNSYFDVCNEVQFAAASFVLGHYVKNFRDVRKIGWLPINERRDLNLLKSCFKALHNTETWPDYLKIIKQECRKELRSSNSIRLVPPTENELKTALSKMMRRSYLTTNQKLLETVKITEPFEDFQEFFYVTDLEYRVISQFYCIFDYFNPASTFNCILRNL